MIKGDNMKLSKICISAVLSTTFLFGSVSPIMLETKGIDINKKVYEDKGLKISIKKGLYVEEKNQVNYLLTLDSKISKTIEIGKEVIELGENKKSEIVVLEVELQKFIDQIEFEQKISSRLKIIERDYELKNSIMKKEHTKNINEIKTVAKNKLLKILTYTKKLENNFVNLQNDLKILKDNTVAKSILDTKIQTISSLQNDLKILNNVNKIMKQKIQYVKTPQELLEELNTRVNSLPHSYDKELLTYTIEDMKQIF